MKAASKDDWYLEYLLGVFCGLRKGEILGLKFSDFDFEQHTVKIERQLGASPVMEERSGKIASCSVEEKDPKTQNSFRTLRMPSVVEQEVLRRQQVVEAHKSCCLTAMRITDTSVVSQMAEPWFIINEHRFNKIV